MRIPRRTTKLISANNFFFDTFYGDPLFEPLKRKRKKKRRGRKKEKEQFFSHPLL